MSETIRIYSGTTRKLGAAPRVRRRRRLGLPFLLALIAIVVAYVAWTTRDSYPMHRFVRADARLNLTAADLLAKRERIASSSVWGIFPDDHPLADMPATLRENAGLPDWALRNIVGPRVRVYGDDLDALRDPVIVTRMSPVGTLLERFHLFTPAIERDEAGGLDLRHAPEAGLYYAVRGRILIISPSRNAIIRALTLTPEDHTTKGALESAFSGAGGEDFNGSVRFDEGEGIGGAFSTLSFAMRLDPQGGALKLHGMLSETWRNHLAPLLRNSTPATLEAAVDAPIMVSANFGLSVKELWSALGDIFDNDLLTTEQWNEWAAADHGSPAEALTAILGRLGPGIRFSWQGFDTTEMVPVPKLVMLADAPSDRIAAAFESFPEPAAYASIDQLAPYYDPASRRMHVPMPAGPSLEPTATLQGDELLVALGRLNSVPPPVAAGFPADFRGNFFMILKPQESLAALADAGEVLAENGLLANHTPETWRDAVEDWTHRVQPFHQVTLFLKHTAGEIDGELQILGAP